MVVTIWVFIDGKPLLYAWVMQKELLREYVLLTEHSRPTKQEPKQPEKTNHFLWATAEFKLILVLNMRK